MLKTTETIRVRLNSFKNLKKRFEKRLEKLQYNIVLLESYIYLLKIYFKEIISNTTIKYKKSKRYKIENIMLVLNINSMNCFR